MVFDGANVEHADERLVRPSWGCHFAPRRRGRSCPRSDGQAHSCSMVFGGVNFVKADESLAGEAGPAARQMDQHTHYVLQVYLFLDRASGSVRQNKGTSVMCASVFLGLWNFARSANYHNWNFKCAEQ